MRQISVPDYYPKFRCNGPQCEDTCCGGGWNINIDAATYHRYEQERHPPLAPLFTIALHKNTSPEMIERVNYGVMNMNASGQCHFLRSDKLCAIHQHLGPSALSDTCRIYPRYLNRFGAEQENALAISCPEAARLILLNPEPMRFITAPADPVIDDGEFFSYRFPLSSEGDSEQIAILNDFRAVIIAILQFRDISLGARLMTLGFLLDDAQQITQAATFAHAVELLPVLQQYADMLGHPEVLETQFASIQGNIPRKLALATALINEGLNSATAARFKDCLQAAATGFGNQQDAAQVLRDYTTHLNAHYRPYFVDKEFIFENYLVNQVVSRLFPFTRGTFLDLYRELVCNLAMLQILLVGMSARFEGLNESRVIQLFQSFARNSNNNPKHIDNVLRALHPQADDSFVHVMWLLKEDV